MGGLLETVEVVRVATPRAIAFDAPGCAMKSEVADVCDPEREVLTNDAPGNGSGPDRNMFSVIVSLESRLMCSPGDEEKWVDGALEFETEKAAGKVLWGDIGDNAANVSLMASTVGTVAAGADARASVGAALAEFWSRATGVGYDQTFIHLGVDRLLELFGEIEDSLVKNLNIKVVTSAGYPPAGIAITGPIRVELGPGQTLQQQDQSVNDQFTEANRLGTLEFDPCIAVRVS